MKTTTPSYPAVLFASAAFFTAGMPFALANPYLFVLMVALLFVFMVAITLLDKNNSRT